MMALTHVELEGNNFKLAPKYFTQVLSYIIPMGVQHRLLVSELLGVLCNAFSRNGTGGLNDRFTQKHNAILQEQRLLMEDENRSTSYDNVASALELLQGKDEVCYAKPLAAQGKKLTMAATGCTTWEPNTSLARQVDQLTSMMTEFMEGAVGGNVLAATANCFLCGVMGHLCGVIDHMPGWHAWCGGKDADGFWENWTPGPDRYPKPVWLLSDNGSALQPKGSCPTTAVGEELLRAARVHRQ
jgi:hypothetical protein